MLDLIRLRCASWARSLRRKNLKNSIQLEVVTQEIPDDQVSESCYHFETTDTWLEEHIV